MSRRSRWWLPWLAFAGALALTAAGTLALRAAETAQARFQSEREAVMMRARIKRRLDNYVAMLRGLAGFIATTPALDRTVYARYVKHFSLSEQYPGVLGLGFSRRVPAGEAASFVASQQASEPGFRIWPPGERGEYHAIVQIEPLDRRNRAAIGYDMSSHPLRRAAMEKARDSGLPSISRRVTLVQEIDPRKQGGFLILVPVYATEDAPTTLEERRKQLVGFAYAPFRADDLFEGIFGPAPPPLQFQAYDAAGASMLASGPPADRATTSLPIEIAGSEWRLAFAAPADAHGFATPLVAIAGLTASVLLLLAMRMRAAASERRRIDSARVEASERRYRQLFDESPLPTWVYDNKTLRFLDVNTAAVRRYGWTREEFLSMTLLDIRPPEEVPRLLVGLAGVGLPSRPVRHRRKNGEEILVEISVQDFLFDDCPARLVVVHDVTERERILAERRKLEARFARLSESGLLGVTLAEAETGKLIEANDAFLDLVGYSRADLEAGRLDWGSLTAPESRAAIADIGEQLQRRGFAGPSEKSYLRKDGGRAHVLIGLAFNDPATVIAFTLDVGERKQRERLEREAHELEAQNRRYQEANRLKSEFLATMSHELRTPLNAIVGFTQMMHDGELGALNAEQRQCLDDVLGSSHHLLQLINDLLDLAKVEAGRMEFQPREVRVDALIAEVVATLRPQLAAGGLTVREEVADDLGTLVIDALRFKQVLYNYLSNAIKFSPGGGVIAIRARRDGDARFRLEVEDNGIGISAADLPKLFVDFQQLDSGPTRRHGGTGLGLALTRRLVEAQGGSVGVRSEVGRGSVFHAVLPCRPEAR